MACYRPELLSYGSGGRVRRGWEERRSIAVEGFGHQISSRKRGQIRLTEVLQFGEWYFLEGCIGVC